jgi:hypothetical protein
MTPTTCAWPSRACQRRLQHLHLVATPDEARAPAGSRNVQASAHLSEPDQLVYVHRAVHAFDFHLPEIGQREVSLYQGSGIRHQIDLPRLGDLFHARRETDRVSLRGIVHVEVVAPISRRSLRRS